MKNRITWLGGMLIAAALIMAACAPVGPEVATTEPPASSNPEPAPVDPDPVEAPAEEPAAPAIEPTSSPADQPPAAAEAPLLTYRIVPQESEARFIIGEILRGQPKTVIGVTSSVEGEITASLSSPAESSISTIRVDAATLQTDNSFRNQALQRFILQTGQFPFIEFAPTALIGLPEQAAVGDTLSFDIVGNLTVHGVTQQVTFATTVTIVSETRLEGLASTVVLYRDYNITIPEVEQVAGVDEEVTLELEFVANAG